MTPRPLAAVLLAACWAPRPTPPIGNTPPRETKIVVTPEPAGCEVVASTKLRVNGTEALAEVISCDLGQEPAGDDPSSDFTITKREGFVKITPPGVASMRTHVAAWTDGWEWGGEVGLEDVLVATTGTTDAVLVVHQTHSIDDSGRTLIAFAVRDADVQRLGSWRADLLGVESLEGGRVARVQTCSLGDPTIEHPGCGGREDADPGPSYELRWTGAALDEKQLAP